MEQVKDRNDKGRGLRGGEGEDGGRQVEKRLDPGNAQHSTGAAAWDGERAEKDRFLAEEDGKDLYVGVAWSVGWQG